MNAIQRDKAFARRIARAGCLDALGIVRVTTKLEAARPLTNAERVSAWRSRCNTPGFAGCYVRPYTPSNSPCRPARGQALGPLQA